MTPADQYRVKAGDLAALARAESNPFGKAEYLRLSQAYLRLAEQAERNSQNDVVWYDALIDPPTRQQQQQQQSQQQPQQRQGSGGATAAEDPPFAARRCLQEPK
jgi:hypothetical protein